MTQRRWFPYLMFLAMTLAYSVPLIFSRGRWGGMDWDQFTFWSAVQADAIRGYFQFPLWNPFSGGGVQMFAMPHSSVLSPLFLPVLVFGALAGLKILWALSLFIGLCGMYRLCRHMKMGGMACLLSPVIFMFCSFMTLHFAEGHMEWAGFALLPWAVLCTLKAVSSRAYRVYAPLLFCLMILGGFPYAFALSAVLSAVFFFTLAAVRRDKAYAVTVIRVICIGALFAAVKVVPLSSLMRENPRLFPWSEKIGAGMLRDIFLERDQESLYQGTKGTGPDTCVYYKGRRYMYGWHEYGAYLGLVPLLLAMGGLFVRDRWKIPAAVLFLFSCWFAFGSMTGCDWAWQALHRLPVYRYAHVPTRFLAGVVFSAALLAGLALTRLEERFAKKRAAAWALAALCACAAADLLSVDLPLVASSFRLDPVAVPSRAPFTQRYRKLQLYPAVKSRSSMYPAFLGNAGVINSYEVVPFHRGEVFVDSEPGYRGELYFVGGENSIGEALLTPNAVSCSVEVKEREALLLNQNFDRGWHAWVDGEPAPVVPARGVVSVMLAPGDRQVVLRYLPVEFLCGLLVSLAALACLLLRRRKVSSLQ